MGDRWPGLGFPVTERLWHVGQRLRACVWRRVRAQVSRRDWIQSLDEYLLPNVHYLYYQWCKLNLEELNLIWIHAKMMQLLVTAHPSHVLMRGILVVAHPRERSCLWPSPCAILSHSSSFAFDRSDQP
jgi:hypothetical protein